MSRKSLMWSIVAIAAVFVVASALTFGPEAWGGPRAGERNIQPGGGPSKIRSYYAECSVSGTVIIPKVDGPNGYIIRGFHMDVSTRSQTSLILKVDTGSGPQVIGRFFVPGRGPYTPSQQVVLDPGIPVPASAVVSVDIDGHVTVTGYNY